MRFRIVGHEVTSDRPIELGLDADSAPDARRRAIELGVRVESVTESPAFAPGDQAAQTPVLVRMEPGYIQTIEKTGKTWKALLLVSLVLLTLGVASCSWAVMRDPRALTRPPLLSISGATLAIVGLAGVITARIGAWWKHG